MTSDLRLFEETAEDLFENAPCGYLTTLLDGTIVRVNRSFERLTGRRRGELLSRRRFPDLLTAGGRIYYETHCRPLLHMQGSLREVAVDIVRADGSTLPALISSVVRGGEEEGGTPVVRTTVFDATDRRRYEKELLKAKRHEEEIAHLLQRSMLSGELPAGNGLEIGVTYRPAEAGLEVGGDWYDAFWLEEGRRAGLVVGDVVGRGIEAAATMGQLRSAVRALASTGLGPAELVETLDRYSQRHDIGELATLVYAELTLEPAVLRYACAGQPPPALVRRDEQPRLLWEGRSTPLNAAEAGVERVESTIGLLPGDTIALYTDGLIERRAETLSEGFERLLGDLAVEREQPPAALAAAVVHALRTPEERDDVCLLVARLGVSGQA
jgi:phosphoserine phosphatase RsbU/P